MIIGNFEDYSKENLISMWLYVLIENTRVKTLLNSAGLSKYTSIGQTTINYRTELKKHINSIKEDLTEDFGFNPIKLIADPNAWVNNNILDTLKFGKTFSTDGEVVQISLSELLQLLRVIDYNCVPENNDFDFRKLNAFTDNTLLPFDYLISFIGGDKTGILTRYFKQTGTYGNMNLTFHYPDFCMSYKDLETKRMIKKNNTKVEL